MVCKSLACTDKYTSALGASLKLDCQADTLAATPNPSGSSISPESRRRILAALNGFRPKFRQIARTLTDVDLVFVEEAMERWMLEYDRAFACMSGYHPSSLYKDEMMLTLFSSDPHSLLYMAPNG